LVLLKQKNKKSNREGSIDISKKQKMHNNYFSTVNAQSSCEEKPSLEKKDTN